MTRDIKMMIVAILKFKYGDEMGIERQRMLCDTYMPIYRWSVIGTWRLVQLVDKTKYVHSTMSIPLNAVMKPGDNAVKSSLRPQKANRRWTGGEESHQE